MAEDKGASRSLSSSPKGYFAFSLPRDSNYAVDEMPSSDASAPLAPAEVVLEGRKRKASASPRVDHRSKRNRRRRTVNLEGELLLQMEALAAYFGVRSLTEAVSILMERVAPVFRADKREPTGTNDNLNIC